jgi:hypothetical protein
VEIFLRLLQLGDVDVGALPDLRRAVIVPVERGLLANPDGPAVARDHPVLDTEWGPGRVRAGRVVVRFVDVVGVDDAIPEVGVAEPLLRPVAEQALDLRTDESRGELGRIGG